MWVPELPNTFDAATVDPSDDQLRYVFAIGPLHADVADQLATVVDGCKELWLENVSSSDRNIELTVDYSLLANPDTTSTVRDIITDTLDHDTEHYILPMLGHLASKPESVFLLGGDDPDVMHGLRQTANKAMLQYFEACSLLLPHSALQALGQQAWRLNARATSAMDQAMATQLLHRSQNTTGSIGVVAATAHYTVPRLVVEAGHPVNTTVIGSGQLPYSVEYGQRMANLQESGQPQRLAPDLEELQYRTLLTDLYYTSGLLLSTPVLSTLDKGQSPTAYDYHLAREAAQNHVEAMPTSDVRFMLTILSNLNISIGDLDERDRGDASVNRPGIVAAGRALIGAALRQWPAVSSESP